MPNRSLEEVIQEKEFVGLLRGHAEVFFRLSNTLLAHSPDDEGLNKKYIYQLINDSDDLESFLDDYGARYNRTYNYFRELVASARWFAFAGFSLQHMGTRLDSYMIRPALTERDVGEATASISVARVFVLRSIAALLKAILEEGETLGLNPTRDVLSEEGFEETFARMRLPRNVGQQDPADEEERIAEVASKFVSACAMLEELSIRRIPDLDQRSAFLAGACSEEKARVYEATVHNLQSAYDTYIKNTLLEAQDERLLRLRGHTSAALHLLEAVTYLTHFVERHENGLRSKAADQRIARLVKREEVQDITLNVLLYWANRFMQSGSVLAEDLLPSYTNVQELTVELSEEVQLHARPAALIVGIVGKHGTPVELQVNGERCNAGSILDLLVTVGSFPEARRFVFRGDEKPLADIALLFEHGLGEAGIDTLPTSLQYLRGS